MQEEFTLTSIKIWNDLTLSVIFLTVYQSSLGSSSFFFHHCFLLSPMMPRSINQSVTQSISSSAWSSNAPVDNCTMWRRKWIPQIPKVWRTHNHGCLNLLNAVRVSTFWAKWWWAILSEAFSVPGLSTGKSTKCLSTSITQGRRRCCFLLCGSRKGIFDLAVRLVECDRVQVELKCRRMDYILRQWCRLFSTTEEQSSVLYPPHSQWYFSSNQP